MITWLMKDRKMELVPDLLKKEKYHFYWGRGGTMETHDECTEVLEDFVDTYGGPHGQQQWQADGIEAIHSSLWVAACQVWGDFPVLVQDFEGK